MVDQMRALLKELGFDTSAQIRLQIDDRNPGHPVVRVRETKDGEERVEEFPAEVFARIKP